MECSRGRAGITADVPPFDVVLTKTLPMRTFFATLIGCDLSNMIGLPERRSFAEEKLRQRSQEWKKETSGLQRPLLGRQVAGP